MYKNKFPEKNYKILLNTKPCTKVKERFEQVEENKAI